MINIHTCSDFFYIFFIYFGEVQFDEVWKYFIMGEI